MRSNTYLHAKRELDILVKSLPDPENRPTVEPFIKEILALCDKFGKSGQSGGSAAYTATAISHAIKTLCLQEPICPITGIDEEWMDVTDMGYDGQVLYQNNRASAVFRVGENNKDAYYLDAITWKNQHGMNFSGPAYLKDEKYSSRQLIKSFPFTPKTFYIDIIEEEVAPRDWVFHIKDPKQLKKVFRYYDRYVV